MQSMPKKTFETQLLYYSNLDRLPDTIRMHLKGHALAVAPRNREHALCMIRTFALAHKVTPTATPEQARRNRIYRRISVNCKRLAEGAGYASDEHGTYKRGDWWSVKALDFVGPEVSVAAPYLDQGGEGLGLIAVQRKRVYAKSSRWFPSHAESRYLVGRNEIGTYFAHPVPNSCTSVVEALDWIWSGNAWVNETANIIARQGDIALVKGKGPKVPDLPKGHRVEGEQIVHNTHPAIRLPGKGERIIVAKRAAARVSPGTRD